MRAQGTFSVQFASHPPYDDSDGVTIGRATVSKQFVGDLVAHSTVEMLSVRTPVKGSAAYVAIEKVRGTLGGRSGSFVLSHLGNMRGGNQSLLLSVVADAATGELAGLSGTMQIDIKDGVHSYTMDYAFAEGAAS